MSTAWSVIYLLVCGVRDSLKVSPIKRYVLTPHANSRAIRKILTESFVHLFIYFILSILCFYVLSSSKFFQGIRETNAATETIVFVLYYVCWLGPLYVITTIYTFFWFGDIAALSFEIEREYYHSKIVSTRSSIETLGANALKKIVFMVIYMATSILVSNVVGGIPFIGYLSSVAVYSVYFALFLFMLKWNYNPYILAFFEANIAYFFGFGLLYSWFTSLFTGPLNDGVYWMLFPIYIFNSTCTQPPHLKQQITSFGELRKLLAAPDSARENVSYDEHLKRLRDDQPYKKKCLEYGSFFKTVRYLTNVVNSIIGKYLL